MPIAQSAIRYTHHQHGLDTGELILRTEEVFLIDLPDDKCSKIATAAAPPIQPTMQPYRNPNSGVVAFTLHENAVDIEFRDGERYRYDATQPGPEAVATMKRLAVAGHGLATFINQHIRTGFARHLPSRSQKRQSPPKPPL